MTKKHTKKSQQPHPNCALTETARMLALTFAAQAARYEAGNLECIREAWILLQLHEIIRAGICSKTRVLDRDETPGVQGLLDQLPSSMKKRIIKTIVAEMG